MAAWCASDGSEGGVGVSSDPDTLADLDESAVLRAMDGDRSVPLSSDEMLACVDRLRQRGKTFEAIGETLGVEPRTVYDWHSRITKPTPRGPRRITSEDVTRRAGITYRMVDYWTRADLIPGVEHLVHRGSGYPRSWTEREVQFVCRLAQLVKAGISPRVASEALVDAVARAHGDLDAVAEVRLPGGLAVTLRPLLTAVASP